MDGVMILNTYQTYSFWGAVLLASGIVSAFICGAVAFAMFDDNIIFGGVFVGLAVVIIIGCFAIPKSETIHEVTIDDSVSWNEFAEHYKVLQERGRILRVEEREQKDGQSIF